MAGTVIDLQKMVSQTYKEFEKIDRALKSGASVTIIQNGVSTEKAAKDVVAQDIVEMFNAKLIPTLNNELNTFDKQQLKQLSTALAPHLTPRYMQPELGEPDPSLGARAKRPLKNPLLDKMDEGISPTTDDLNNDASRLADSMLDPNKPREQILEQFKNVLKNQLKFKMQPEPKPEPKLTYIPKPKPY